MSVNILGILGQQGTSPFKLINGKDVDLKNATDGTGITISGSDLLLIDDVDQTFSFEGVDGLTGGGAQASTKKVTFSQVLTYINSNISSTAIGIAGPTDGDVSISSDGNITFILDDDNDETSQSFSFKNDDTEIANLDESGNLQIDGGITTGSTSFVNSSGVIQVATQGTIDHDSLANFVAEEHYRWDTDISSTATIHANNIPTLNQNTSGTAAGLSGTSLTSVNSILNTSLVAGRDADNQIKFSTDNQIIFRVSGGDGITMKASGEIEATKFDGALEGNADTATLAAGLSDGAISTGDTFTFRSSNANDPLFIIKNTNDGANGPRLKLLNDRASDGQDDDEAGIIEFVAKDDGTPTENTYAKITGLVSSATAGSEEGTLEFKVSNGSGGDLTALKLDGDGTHNFSGTVSATTFIGALTGNATGLSSTLAVSSGGTGATTLTSTGILLGNGTSAIQASSNIKVTSDILTIKNEETDAGGSIKFLEGSDNGSHGTIIQSTDNLGSNITVNLPNSSGTLALTSGSVATLTNARTIGGVSFNGSANIDLPGVNTNGNQSIEYTPTSSEQAAGNNSAIIIKEGNTTTVAGKVYYLAPNGTWVLANAGAEGTRSGLLGVAVGTNSTTNGMVTKGLVTISTHATSGGVGKTVYLHTTDGLMTTTAPSSVRILGAIVKHHSNRCEVYFNPDNFNGQAANPSSSFVDDYALTFDGTGDYAVASLPTDWGKSTGTLSVWVNLNITDDSTKNLVAFTTGDGSFNDFALLQYYKVTSGKYAIICRQKRTISGVSTEHVTVAQKSSTYHGRPFTRISSDFTSIQENYNSIRTSDTWTHIAVTWDKDDTYTYSSTTYNGNQTIYVNGTKVGEGTSTMPGSSSIGTSNSMNQARVNNLTNVYLGTLSPSHGMANMIMDDLAIWSSALDDNNITAIYNSGTPSDLTINAGNYDQQGNLVGYWKMESNTNDSSSNSNSLSLYADTTYVNDSPST